MHVHKQVLGFLLTIKELRLNVQLLSFQWIHIINSFYIIVHRSLIKGWLFIIDVLLFQWNSLIKAKAHTYCWTTSKEYFLRYLSSLSLDVSLIWCCKNDKTITIQYKFVFYWYILEIIMLLSKRLPIFLSYLC